MEYGVLSELKKDWWEQLTGQKRFMIFAGPFKAEGNRQILLCERGIRTFETMTRNTLDISAVPLLKKLTPYPVLIDPSHAAGRTDIIPALAKAAVAAGADGLLIEVHPEPQKALSDGKQSLDLTSFSKFLEDLRPWLLAAGRRL
ncbi:hypothetical protein [Carboxydothermus pertinax]|uniref:3-deoxy-7-phosphoheptulonate synthase n=1 Tax=Carboxydothermus pertinax TaxID=870242 RepID=A0A1L8CUL7_9THEO|nr:3-deoxy-7-phosphoheptulonate synthase [Carboxydothermus pertinax]